MGISLNVKTKKRSFQPIYFLKPSELFDRFEKILRENIEKMESNRVTNRAVKEFLKRKGERQLRKLRKAFLELDKSSLIKRKAVYNTFYRIFQRLDWALNSESEKEIEIKVWITSSIDYLSEFVEILEENNEGNIK